MCARSLDDTIPGTPEVAAGGEATRHEIRALREHDGAKVGETFTGPPQHQHRGELAGEGTRRTLVPGEHPPLVRGRFESPRPLDDRRGRDQGELVPRETYRARHDWFALPDPRHQQHVGEVRLLPE